MAVQSLIDDALIRSRSVAFGPERTMEQDPTFAFRIIVDIALKAFSPAINDPTTAVLVDRSASALFEKCGQAELRTDDILDGTGQLRLIIRTPNWEDFVHLTFNEIRLCGANNAQVARRLRSMLENLIQTLPARRHPALLELDSSVCSTAICKGTFLGRRTWRSPGYRTRKGWAGTLRFAL